MQVLIWPFLHLQTVTKGLPSVFFLALSVLKKLEFSEGQEGELGDVFLVDHKFIVRLVC